MKVKMQQKKDRNSLQRVSPRRKILVDVFVVLFCLSGATTGIYLFWQDLNRSLVKQSEAPVGTITFKRNIAQRRFQDRLIWSQLQRESPIYNGDIIRTSELSDTSITFLDGNTIDLSEASLIQIFYDKDGARIELSGGAVNVNATTGGITLVSGGTELKLGEGSKISAGASELGEGLNLQVIEGNAVVNTGEGIQQVESGSALTVQNDGSTSRNAQVVVSFPSANQRMVNSSSGTVPVDFTWSTANFSEDEHTRVEVATDRNFTQLVKASDTNATAATIDLPAGTYFWRAYATTSSSASRATPTNASSGRLTILHTESLVLRSPLSEAVYSYRVNSPTIRFQWSAVEGAGDADIQYRLEIADNPQMTNPQLRTVVSSVSFSYTGLDDGIWYWRVTPIFPADYQGNPDPSITASFVVRRATELITPSLLAPESGSVVNSAADGRGIYFSWRKENDAASYTLQLARDMEFRNPVFSRTLTDTVYTWNPSEIAAESGRYYWRVSYTDIEGALSPLSESRFFTAISGTPTHEIIFPPDNYTISDEVLSSLRFAWRTNLPFSSRFQIAASSDFSRLMVDESISALTNERAFQGVFLADGTYYWRVSTSNAAGDTSMQTPAQRLTIAPPLPSPQGLEPQGRIVPESNDTLVFRWNAVPDAELYEFSLYEGGSLGLGTPRLVYQNQNVRQTFLSLPRSTVREGAYFWTVSAVTEESTRSSRRASQAALGQFQLSVPQQVLLEYPPANYAFTGLEALRQPSMIRWSSSETLGTSRLIVSRSPTLNGETALEIVSPAKTVNLPVLTEGTYYWTVQATTPEGIDISAPTQTFRVLPLSITRVSLDFPQTGYTYTGVDALRRPGTAQWSSEERVGTSRFILSRNADLSGTPILELNNPGRSITLPALTEGTYYWTIQATTPEGIDISATSPQTFRILPISATPVTLDSPVTGYSYTGLDALRRPGAIRWSSIETIGDSRFILSRNADLSGEPVLELSNPGKTITLPTLTEGTYYWTIQATTPEGIDISATSPRSFRVLPVSVSQVSLDLPAAGHSYTGQDALRRPGTIRWSSTETIGDSYFILSRNPDLSGEPVYGLSNPGRTISLPILTEGTYYWTIQATTPEGIDISATPRSFRVLAVDIPRVSLDSPAAGHSYTGLDALRRPGTIRWSSSEIVGNSRFILSRNPDLSGETVYEQTNPSRAVLLPILTEGTYYWTIQAETLEGIDISAAPRSFRVLAIEAPRVSLDSPAAGHSYTGLDALRRPGTLRWSSSETVSSSRFILSRNAELSDPVYELVNPNRAITLPALAEGTYYWTIQAETPEGIDISAVPRSFRVLPSELARVSLETPAETPRFTVSEIVRRLVTLRWSSTELVRSSRFILSRNADPMNSTALINITNPETTLILPRLDPGVYYWTIQAETPEGIDISAETVGSFEVLEAPRVTLEAPTDSFAYNGLDALRQPGMLRWGSSEPVGASRLIISRSPDIARGEIILYLINPPRTVSLPKLTPGIYYWTIQAETPEGIDISAERPFSLHVLTIPLLEPPRVISPINNAIINLAMIQRDKSITFTWEASPGANAYIFTLAPASNPQGALIRSDPLPRTTYTIANLSLLDSGDFIWRVEPVSVANDGSIEQRGQTSEVRFTIDVPPLSKPSLGVSGSLYGD
ncbi:MAG: hypothetical protein LBD79_07225 [Treponema sp.]|jgi:hypothetical protein|nr:hypothetical protein [Treponema sp.]